MHKIPGYEIESLFIEGKNNIYKGVDKKNNKKVLIKISNIRDSEEFDNHITNEYETVSRLNHQNIIKFISIINIGTQHAIIMPYNGGSTLSNFIKKYISTEQFYKIAIQLTNAIDYLHKNGVIHRDINPENILIDEDGNAVIIDFGFAINTKRQYDNIKISEIEGTLEYIAPEQTGRMNREIDYRSDLYSLGVTFYQMLTGKLPFYAKDAHGWIYAHMTHAPKEPNKISAEVPTALSDLVMLLLQKNPEKRYQSSNGLLHDLTTLKTGGDIELKQYDMSPKLTISQKIYGRDKEQALLKKRLKNCINTKETVYVTGPAGIGKTSIIMELIPLITEMRGIFVFGKFEKGIKTLHYSAIRSVFENLTQNMFTLDMFVQNAIKTDLLKEISTNARVLTELIPTLSTFFNDAPRLEELNYAEQQNRFNYVTQSFIRVLSEYLYPIVIFLDDLQWMDSASLSWLKDFQSSDDIGKVMFIGAYRSDEIKENNPLLEHIKSPIELMPLSEDSVEGLLEDSLFIHGRELEKFAGLIIKKTASNPFYIKHFLEKLHQDGILLPNFEKQCWEYDEKRLLSTSESYNVIKLLESKLKSLEPALKNTLSCASIIGFEFETDLLSELCGLKRTETINRLDKLEQRGFIVPVTPNKELYRFVHDNIFESAQTLLDEKSEQELSFKLGSLLNEDKLIKKVMYLNHSIGLIKEEDMQNFAKLNYKAAKLAVSSFAFAQALEFANMAKKYLPDTLWSDGYEIMSDLHFIIARSSLATGNLESAQNISQILIDNVRNDYEKLMASSILIDVLAAKGHLAEAIHVGVQALNNMGILIPEDPEELKKEVEVSFMRVEELLSQKSYGDILAMNKCNDLATIEITEIATSLIPAVYVSGNFDLFAILITKSLIETLEKGLTAYSSHLFCMYGVIIEGGLNQYKRAYEFGDLGLKMQKLYDNNSIAANNQFVVACFLLSWFEPVKNSIDLLFLSEHTSELGGNFAYRNFSLTNQITFFVYSETPLNKFDNIIEKNLNTLKKADDRFNLPAINFLYYFWQALIGNTKAPYSLDTDNFKCKTLEDEVLAAKSYQTTCAVGRIILILDMMYQRYEHGYDEIVNYEPYLGAMMGHFSFATNKFLFAFFRLAKYQDNDKKTQTRIMESVYETVNFLQERTDDYPNNFIHMLMFLKAELARIDGDIPKTMKLYEEAQEHARENGFVLSQAIFAERYALYAKENGFMHLFELEIKKAYDAYHIYGVKPKLEELKKEYNYIFADNLNYEKNTVYGSSFKGSQSIDIMSIKKATQVQLSELNLKKLIKNMMEISLKNIGADYGVLIFQEEHNLIVKAVAKNSGITISDIPLEDFKDIPKSVISALMVSKEAITINNTRKEPSFANENYFKKKGECSAFAVKLRHREETVAILYLENCSVTDAFSLDRQYVMEVILSQATIALENAKLFNELNELNATLEKKVAEEVEKNRQKDQLLIAHARQAAMGEILVNISHHWRQPLNILGLIVQDFEDAYKFHEMNKEYIEDNTKNMMSIIQDMSKTIDAFNSYSKNSKEKSIFSLLETIEKIYFLFKETFESNKIAFSIEVDKKTKVKGAQSILIQVISSLCTNSIEAINKNKIGSGSININSKIDNNNLEIVIEDNGGGIKKDIISTIFDPYSTTKGVSRGLGMGLYMALQQIKINFDGNITAQNTKKGARFIISIPDTFYE